MKMKFLIAVMLVIGLTGCLSGYKEGTSVTSAMTQTFVVGTTTTDEVKAKIGYPDQITNDGGMTQYIYNYTEINHIGGNKDEKTVFEFSKAGKLKNIIRGRGASSNNPLLQ